MDGLFRAFAGMSASDHSAVEDFDRVRPLRPRQIPLIQKDREREWRRASVLKDEFTIAEITGQLRDSHEGKDERGRLKRSKELRSDTLRQFLFLVGYSLDLCESGGPKGDYDVMQRCSKGIGAVARESFDLGFGHADPADRWGCGVGRIGHGEAFARQGERCLIRDLLNARRLIGMSAEAMDRQGDGGGIGCSLSLNRSLHGVDPQLDPFLQGARIANGSGINRGNGRGEIAGPGALQTKRDLCGRHTGTGVRG